MFLETIIVVFIEHELYVLIYDETCCILSMNSILLILFIA